MAMLQINWRRLKALQPNTEYVRAIEDKIIDTISFIESAWTLCPDAETRKQYEACLKILRNYKTAKLHWTVHTGKLEGIDSLNSDCTINPFCLARMKNGEAICSECFAGSLLSFRLSLHCWTLVNTYVLNSRLLTPDEIPVIRYSKRKMALNPELYVRIESYGDAGSVLQVINFLLVVAFNPDYRFAAWTKNLNLWHQAIKIFGKKPKNLRLGFSSIKLNVPSEIPQKFIYMVDFRFTVFTKEYVKLHPEIIIVCAGVHCVPCGKCYNGKRCKGVPYVPGTKIRDIFELLRPKGKMIAQIGCKNS